MSTIYLFKTIIQTFGGLSNLIDTFQWHVQPKSRIIYNIIKLQTYYLKARILNDEWVVHVQTREHRLD